MGQIKEPWNMLADQKIWSMLGNPEYDLSNDYIRLLIIELFSRIKKLEVDNYTTKILLLETGLVTEETYDQVSNSVKEFFRNYDAKKAAEVEFYSKSGISFVDWVNFMMKGKFEAPDDKEQ